MIKEEARVCEKWTDKCAALVDGLHLWILKQLVWSTLLAETYPDGENIMEVEYRKKVGTVLYFTLKLKAKKKR